jgi:hypothetical protein
VNRELRNPFASILFCEKCGAVMKRNTPSKKQNTKPWYRCPTRGCNCKAIKCDALEQAIVDAMREWLENYRIEVGKHPMAASDSIHTSLEAVRGQLTQLQAQQDSLCDYLEKGVYTIAMFTKRNAILSRDIEKLRKTEEELLQKQLDDQRISKATIEIIPTTQQILDHYDLFSVSEKNEMWKLIMRKATVFRTKDDQLSLHIYPNLPQ